MRLSPKFRLGLVFAFALALTTFVSLPATTHADGLIIIDCPPSDLPPLPFPIPEAAPTASPFMPPTTRPPYCPPRGILFSTVKNHNVTVTIENQVARTHVDETFLNENSVAVEGTYIFPLPDDATISDFAMWADGKRLEGQILDKNQARQIYENIVRTQRDPALLEYVGRNAFQARVFPIPARGEKRIELEYSQVLKADQGLVRYVYPLNTEKFSPKPLLNVSVNINVQSNAAIKAIYSPSHEVSISRDGAYKAKVGYEDSQVKPDRDFVLYYSVSQDDIGVNLLSFKSMGEDGFFLMLVSPQVSVQTYRVLEKDIILVLDTSGSMQGTKLDQAKRALNYVLGQLNQGDRFDILTFSTGTNAFAATPQPVSATSSARNFVASLRAEGSTDINRALLEAAAMADKSRPTIMIFLTDGLPTAGEANADKIIANVTQATPRNVRLFTFGVGDDVNTILLDSLTDRLRGASAYVRPNEKIDEIVSGFYAKVSTPVLSDTSVDWGGIQVSDVYPYPMPDLFVGSQLVIAGRYRNGGTADVTLKGTVNGNSQSFKYSELTFRSYGGEDMIPRLWATRKIGYLLSQIRLRGESKEAVGEIVSLAVRYGIVTPYTSFLVDERSDVLTEAGRGGAAQSLNKSFSAPGAIPTAGAAAVQQSQAQSLMRGAGVAPAMPTAAPRPGPSGIKQETAPIQAIGDRTFLLRNGVWTDTQFDPSKMTTQKIEFGSDAYMTLAQGDAGRFLALGARVILLVDGIAYEITTDGTGSTASGNAPAVQPNKAQALGSATNVPATPVQSIPDVTGSAPNPQDTDKSTLDFRPLVVLGTAAVALLAGTGGILLVVLRK